MYLTMSRAIHSDKRVLVTVCVRPVEQIVGSEQEAEERDFKCEADVRWLQAVCAVLGVWMKSREIWTD